MLAALVLLCGGTASSAAETPSGRDLRLPPCGLRDRPAVETAADLQRLLAKIKERYPQGRILALKRTSLDLEGSHLIYQVKVLPADGRIVWLQFDAVAADEPRASDGSSAARSDRECPSGRS